MHLKYFTFVTLLTLLTGCTSNHQTEVLEMIPPFDWGAHMVPPNTINGGHQIMHFKTTNKSYKDSPTATAFVNKHFSHAKVLYTDADTLRFASDHVKIKQGFYLEMGTATARTTNFLAGLNPTKTIYGFDSFEGLPEEWTRDDKTFPKGTFGFNKKTLELPFSVNVTLYKGWFNKTLPLFKKLVLQHNPIALLHIDCDIYSSTADVFNALAPNIVSGTIIIFDELYNYPGFEKHEWKAFIEFIQRTSHQYRVLAFNANHEQVVIEIL
jgi:hypothetical protein